MGALSACGTNESSPDYSRNSSESGRRVEHNGRSSYTLCRQREYTTAFRIRHEISDDDELDEE